ncbi:MAG: hypothetical protein GC160_16340 [Acidobacteria bacterium]|nr:hypothetical protein [Acidobacteriota bacterium]
MKRLTLWIALACCTLGLASAQEGPTPKSQAELDALLAIQNAADPEAKIAAGQKLLKEFSETEFKAFANQQMMLAAQQLNDYERLLVFGEETLKHDPTEVGALLTLANVIPMRTQEFDLDKEEKLNKAEDYAKQALKVIPTKANPNPGQIPDEQWLLVKKDFMADAHKSLGLIEFKRGNNDAAVNEFKQSIDVAAQQDPASFYFMAEALLKSGKKDEALTAINSSIAGGGLPMADGSNAAEDLKKRIEAGK